MEIFERDKQILIRLKQLCDLNGMEEGIDYAFNNEDYSITINDKNGRGVWIGAAIDEKTNLGQIFIDGDYGKESSAPLRFSFTDTVEWEKLSLERQEQEIQDRLFSILLQEHMLLSTGHNHIRDFVIINRISDYQFPIMAKETDVLTKTKTFFDQYTYMEEFNKAYEQEMEKEPSIKNQDNVFVSDVIKEYSRLQSVKCLEKTIEENPNRVEEILNELGDIFDIEKELFEKDNHNEDPEKTLAQKDYLLGPEGVVSGVTKTMSLGGIFSKNAESFIHDLEEWYKEKNSDFYKNWDKLKTKIEIFTDNLKEQAIETKENIISAFSPMKEYLSNKYNSITTDLKQKKDEYQSKYLERTLNRMTENIEKLNKKKENIKVPFVKDLQHSLKVKENEQKQLDALWDKHSGLRADIDEGLELKRNDLIKKTEERKEMLLKKAEDIKKDFLEKHLENFIRKTYDVKHLSETGMKKIKEEFLNKGWNKNDFKLTLLEEKRIDKIINEHDKADKVLEKELNKLNLQKDKAFREGKEEYQKEKDDIERASKKEIAKTEKMYLGYSVEELHSNPSTVIKGYFKKITHSIDERIKKAEEKRERIEERLNSR